MNMGQEIPSCLVVYWPTGCWKTQLAITLAKKYNGEIVSTDSRQIYRGLTIWTGKILPHEMMEIPHHGIDLIDIREEYSVSLFQSYAREKIKEIQDRSKLPILCWGTGLYIDGVIFDTTLQKAPQDEVYRKELEEFRIKHGNEALWKKLFAIDPEYAKEIHPNSYPYVIRWLEVLKTTGTSKRSLRTERKLFLDTSFISPYTHDRDQLYKAIDARILDMFAKWFVEEVEQLLKNGYTESDPGMKSIGYREVLDLINGKQGIQETIGLIQKLNRNYAKRQITWNRRYEGFRIFHI